MTRKHYVMLAATLAGTKPPEHRQGEHLQWAYDAKAIADTLQRDNARFDRIRFLKAAGVID